MKISLPDGEAEAKPPNSMMGIAVAMRYSIIEEGRARYENVGSEHRTGQYHRPSLYLPARVLRCVPAGATIAPVLYVYRTIRGH